MNGSLCPVPDGAVPMHLFLVSDFADRLNLIAGHGVLALLMRLSWLMGQQDFSFGVN